MFRVKLLIAVSAVLIASSAQGGDTVLLKPKFDNQKLVYIEASDTTRQVMSGALVGGQEMVLQMVSTTGYVQESKAAESGGATTKLTFQRNALSMNNPMMGEMKYDSDTPPDEDEQNPFAAMFGVWTGKSLVLTTDADLKITRLEGWNELVEAMENAAAGEMFYEQMRQGLTEDAIKQVSFERRYAMLPMREVKVGDEWKTTGGTKDPIFGDLTYSYSCKLEKIEEGSDGPMAVIHYTGEGSLKPGVEPKSVQGMTPKLKSTKYEGQVRFDVKRGQPVKMFETRTNEFSLEGPQGGLDVRRETKVEIDTLSPDARAEAKAKRVKEHAAEKKESEEKNAPEGG